jgi:hypothetical protein
MLGEGIEYISDGYMLDLVSDVRSRYILFLKVLV